MTTLLCHVIAGVASVTMDPGMIESPRYDGARIEITIDDTLDIRVNGTYDRNYSYAAHNIGLTATRLRDRWMLEASEGDELRETIIITDTGQMMWTQLANADSVHASSASLFIGSCER